MWNRFFRKLIQSNFASLSMKGPITHRELVEGIAEVSNVPIPVESLPDVLVQTVLPRGNYVFGCPGDYFDCIAQNYSNMQWWLTDKGLNMAIMPTLYERLAMRLQELEGLPAIPRGFAFEGFLDALFAVFGLSPRKSFRLVGEQIDGSFELNGNTYLVEAKWQSSLIGNRELQSFAGTVRTKADWTRGLYVSNSGFSEDGLTAFRQGDNTRIICLSGMELRDIFANNLSLIEVFNLKARRTAETGQPYIPVQELFKIR